METRLLQEYWIELAGLAWTEITDPVIAAQMEIALREILKTEPLPVIEW
ncbi:MAG: hypothetical protein GXP01_08025 [Alphaproteobacteria bacterium]|nr:hypothetical protein [Alphaproteobacteria bacterium]